jgi:glutamine cyclotransferase
MTRTGIWSAAALALLTMDCGQDTPTTPFASRVDVCEGFPPWESSAYVLPYPVGSAFVVNQANCSGFGHSGFWKYGYDFTMQIGTLVTAARGGRVLHSEGGVGPFLLRETHG